MQWVTRARRKVDRIACLWLITNFVDPDAEFVDVPSVGARESASHSANGC